MREATTFSRILEMKLRFEIGRKLLRSSVDRDGFLRRGWTRACFEWRWEDSFRKREIDKICDDWTEFIEAEFQKESWDGVKGTLFTFRSRNEFVNFSESGWNKIGHLWRWGRWRKKRIRRIRWYKFGADAFNFVQFCTILYKTRCVELLINSIQVNNVEAIFDFRPTVNLLHRVLFYSVILHTEVWAWNRMFSNFKTT